MVKSEDDDDDEDDDVYSYEEGFDFNKQKKPSLMKQFQLLIEESSSTAEGRLKRQRRRSGTGGVH